MEELKNVSSIRPKREIVWGIRLPELVFIILVTGLAWIIRGIVYPLFELPFVILTGINMFYLMKKPKDNPTINNLQMYKLVLRRYLLKEYAGYQTIDPRSFSEE
ncbi:DUF5592 family protein [Enterococcus casseliflavus]|jgi:hypothetical protein|uniref:DUF5592 family protein n=1 Tax=Enterococcus casseliflavus TaxID=37734 RepID=UPI002DBF9445|nr:DUF5592 family protein [Enterococcus casseliflavus]MEB6087912.1 DUF5592 family protein [Enterococcus casseliflavus]